MRFFFKHIILVYFVFTSNFYAQRFLKISVDINGTKTSLSYVTKSGNVYVSAKELANLFTVNQFYNSETQKLELKFSDYTLKFTAKNQFVIITKRSDATQTIFQIPVSTLLLKDDIFIPLNYCIDYISLAYGKKIIFDSNSRSMKVTNESIKSLIITNEENKIEDKNIKERADLTKYDIYGISIEEKTNGTLIRFKVNRKVLLPRHSIHNNILYVFFTNVSVYPEIFKDVNPIGLITQCRQVVTSSKNIQFEFVLKEGYSTSEIFQDIESNDIFLTIHNKFFTEQLKNKTDNKAKWIFDVVVIDAGHGGKDPGAIGVSGVKEKNINLGIALKLGKLIEKNLPNVKVVYTRQNDEFVELYKRGKIANEANGKLFISIHCNSTLKKNTNYSGFEVYLLRPGRTQEAIEIAEFENSVIKYEDNPQRYQQLTDENFILVSMAHSQYMRYSEKFSDLLNQEWERKVKIPSNGIKQAGFYVLVGASMPSVLIETGYLSNRKEEAYLNSNIGQTEIAKTIFNAIVKYKNYYDKEIETSLGKEN